MVHFFDRSLVVEFAQLALDVYNNPNDNKLRETEFNQFWKRIGEWPRPDDVARTTRVISTVNPREPGLTSHQHVIKTDYDCHTGFYAALYENFSTKVGVIVIRGTDPAVFLDLVADYNYVMNKVVTQYEEAIGFTHMIRNHYALSGMKKIYVCGHSLGGIVAKMIAPLTGFDTIAFNSPGVMEYLVKRHLPSHCLKARKVPYKDAFDEQKIITYCAKGDPIGNLRHDNDLGPYKFVDVLGGANS